jgi:hypothetical protein
VWGSASKASARSGRREKTKRLFRVDVAVRRLTGQEKKREKVRL